MTQRVKSQYITNKTRIIRMACGIRPSMIPSDTMKLPGEKADSLSDGPLSTVNASIVIELESPEVVDDSSSLPSNFQTVSIFGCRIEDRGRPFFVACPHVVCFPVSAMRHNRHRRPRNIRFGLNCQASSPS